MKSQLYCIVAVVSLVCGNATWGHQERMIESMADGSCQLRVEVDDQSRTLRLRVGPESSVCRPSREKVTAILTAAFARGDLFAERPGTSSLFLGRLVAYGWLMERLVSFAAHDPHWDKRRGRPVAGDLHGYVAACWPGRR